MVCFFPMTAYRPRVGKRLVFDAKYGYADLKLQIPCGQCVGCRLEKSRQWAVRCTHEASLHDDNCFITLTYDQDHLPDDNGLNKRHFQLFMKRLRKKYGAKIRFFHCGEYGDAGGRPHYHACIFNHQFSDLKHWKTINDIPLYISEELEGLWPFGFSTVGELTFQSAAYVARYVMKKITGKPADAHYTDPTTGVVKQSEYTTMSRRPGIGQNWFNQFTTDVYPCDNVVLNGKKFRPPKYYDTQFEHLHPKMMQEIKAKRNTATKKHADNNTPLRLKTRERLQQLKLQHLPREMK